MDTWCPYGIGRESWDREVLRVLGLPLPPKRDISLAGVFPVGGCRRIAPPEVIVVVVAVVVVEY